MSNPDTYAECLSDDISDNTETFEEIAELKEELKALDELAKYYYDYYNEHGTYPSKKIYHRHTYLFLKLYPYYHLPG